MYAGALVVSAGVTLIGVEWWKRWMLKRHRVATSFIAYARLRLRLLG
eukprot:CAMPEP_0174732926 /NCGR_PEP_ID=MMETSP1094-20130205/60311_1 /TAXON_ID=156173 /ORGANISM="Chrysochromulina brevifilum, Strain UTEX LB 985" /LENGTH=46 /DNA_ID= /DNA_START= /DNA_END= /DNA_ORIENTATION=